MEAAKRTRRKSSSSQKWIERELLTAQLPDARLKKRLRKLGEQLSKGVGRSIPWACQDWAATKAAYRFFSNGRVREVQILASHFRATHERVKRGKEPVLIVHDTTEFSYRRKDVAAVGVVSKRTVGKNSDGQSEYFTTCGICLHSSLAVTLAGVPLGLTAVKFWSRKSFKGREAKRRAKRAPIEEKESLRSLDNLRASTSLLGQAERLVRSAIRRAISSICWWLEPFLSGVCTPTCVSSAEVKQSPRNSSRTMAESSTPMGTWCTKKTVSGM